VLHADRYPTRDCYPFNLPVLRQTPAVEFRRAATFFVGENGTGKSTLLEAIARRCRIHIWQGAERRRLDHNPYEGRLHEFLSVQWADGAVPGSFFASQIFRHFAELLDDMAAVDPGQLEHFGGRSLMTQSHGESLMSYFTARYRIAGLYFLDEPETALSPTRQVELVRLLAATAAAGHAQFLVATHSPILLACPDADILSFDRAPLRRVEYEQTQHYRLYKAFLERRQPYLGE
jgi:predicted ATPase